jgi:hypothetical protein
VESGGILQVLWRRRIALAAGLLLALAVGVHGLYQVTASPPALRSRAISSGYALQHVLVDTPTSLIADARARGADSIAIKAAILASLATSEVARDEIARAIGRRPDEVAVVSQSAMAPQTATPLSEQAVEVTRPKAPYIVTFGENATLPVLSVWATAPDAGAAAELAAAATAALAPAVRRDLVAGGGVRIEPQGPAQTGTRSIAPKPAAALLKALALLIAWGTAVFLLDATLRRRRGRAGPSPVTALASNR